MITEESPAAGRRARQVKQTLDDFKLLLLEEVDSRPRLEQWTKSNLESPIAIAFTKKPEETLQTCKNIQIGYKNDRWAIEIVSHISDLQARTIAKDWVHFRKVNGLID